MQRELIPMEHLMFDKQTLFVMGLACLLGGCTAHGYPSAMPTTTTTHAVPDRGYSPIGLATPIPHGRRGHR